MLNNKRIPNLALKFKSNNIWPSRKWAKYPNWPIFDSIWVIKGSNVIRFQFFYARLGSSHYLASLGTPFVVTFTF